MSPWLWFSHKLILETFCIAKWLSWCKVNFRRRTWGKGSGLWRNTEGLLEGKLLINAGEKKTPIVLHYNYLDWSWEAWIYYLVNLMPTCCPKMVIVIKLIVVNSILTLFMVSEIILYLLSYSILTHKTLFGLSLEVVSKCLWLREAVLPA